MTDHVWEISQRKNPTQIQRRGDPDPKKTTDAEPGNPINSLGQPSYSPRPYSTIYALTAHSADHHLSQSRSSNHRSTTPTCQIAHPPDAEEYDPMLICGKSLFPFMGFFATHVGNVHCPVHANYIALLPTRYPVWIISSSKGISYRILSLTDISAFFFNSWPPSSVVVPDFGVTQGQRR